ncbi:MAG: antibiotic biosynthesis monooxygenase [Alphaproteobacteria bacterium]|nr:antibiotic biosynthesis monooxygenase [Alphaproteobacteria bacterium]MDE2043373.1 antibiotic biosynthesis monooxygenase [Alphaproteobacteria bacterium]MDE2341761.1 antibiotic biosynthesis monooxygenase [Alphaproteobacteria bacterium]
MIALIVKLDVHPEHLAAFLDAISEQAERSFNDEPGCLYFDVTQNRTNPASFIFYEVYQDDAALDAHRNTPHFARWREAADLYVVKGSQVNIVRDLLHHHQGLS